jgi:spermidine synthase
MKKFLNKTYLIFYFFGFSSLITQITLLREALVTVQGNELVLGIIWASWFLGISTGAVAGIRQSKHGKKPLDLHFIFLALCYIIIFILEIGILKTSRIFFRIPPGEFFPLQRLFPCIIISITPCSFFVGMLFPIACTAFSKNMKSGYIGKVYIIEALGSMTAGVIYTYYFLPRFHSFLIAAISGLCLISTLLLYLLKSGDSTTALKFRRPLILGIFITSIVLIMLSLPFSGSKVENFFEKLRFKTFSGDKELVASLDTPYQHLNLSLSNGQYNLYSNGQYFFSFPDPYEQAPRAHIPLCEHPNPETVLLIGSGFGGMIPEILLHPQVKRLDFVEIDSGIERIIRNTEIKSSSNYLNEKDPRLHIFYQDPRYFIKKKTNEYDLIILELPDPLTSVINRFFTEDFYAWLAGSLKPGGVVTTGITSSINYYGKDVLDYTASVYYTLKKVFPEIALIPGIRAYFFASLTRGQVTENEEILQKRYTERGVASDFFSNYHFNLYFQNQRIEDFKKSLENVGNYRINTDLMPATYYFSLIIWEICAGSIGSMILKFIRDFPFWLYPFSVIIFFLFRLILIQRSATRTRSIIQGNVLCSIFTTGFSGMAWEMLLVLGFQNQFGSLYSEIGLLVALFMAGIAAGGAVMYLFSGKFYNREMFIAEGLMVLFSFSLLPAYEYFEIPRVCYYLLLFISGFLVGFEFPAAAKVYSDKSNINKNDKIALAAGAVDSSDHAGALWGSIVSGIIFIPLGGFKFTLSMVLLLNFVTWVFWLTTKQPDK